MNKNSSIISELLYQSKLPNFVCENIYTLLKLCLKQNFFLFNKEIYIQKDGLSMGNPMSPLFAEIFMAHFENNIFLTDNNPFRDNIKFYYRYVDDIIINYSGDINSVNHLLQYANSLHPKLQFTVEIESNRTLNFLDYSIKKEGQRLSFEIYRKPTTTDHIIHNNSAHYEKHKYSALYYYIYRLIRSPLSQAAYNKELKDMFYILGKKRCTK